MFALGEEPTLHRMRWGDVDGDGKAELVVVPLHGRLTKAPDWEGAGADTADASARRSRAGAMDHRSGRCIAAHHSQLHHGRCNSDRQQEGVHALQRGARPGASLGKARLARSLGLVRRRPASGDVESWHGNSVVIYENPPSRSHRRLRIKPVVTGPGVEAPGD